MNVLNHPIRFFLVDFISKANVFNSLVSETAFSVINT